MTGRVISHRRCRSRYSRPRSRARTIAARRLVTSSFVKMCLVWVRSVLWETYKLAGDLGPAELAVQQPQHLVFSFGQCLR